MHHLEWSASEKKIARRAHQVALQSVEAGIRAEFKAKAAAVATTSDMWAVESFLRRRRREHDELCDYRYSRLLLIFARLMREGHLSEAQLAGLSGEKLDFIRRCSLE